MILASECIRDTSATMPINKNTSQDLKTGFILGATPKKQQIGELVGTVAAARRVANFMNVSLSELKTFARITGHSSVHELGLDDLVTLNKDIEECTGIPYAGRARTNR